MEIIVVIFILVVNRHNRAWTISVFKAQITKQFAKETNQKKAIIDMGII
jgi:hypothetical protein